MKRYLMIVSFLFAIGCTESMIYMEQPEDKGLSMQTKSTEISSYYWYKGRKIPLILNQEYANIITTPSEGKNTLFKEIDNLSTLNIDKVEQGEGFIKIRLKNDARDTRDYQTRINDVKEKLNVNEIYPYYQQGADKAPIGTSDVFYVKLIDDEDTAPLEEIANQTGVEIVESFQYSPEWYVLSISGSDFKSSVDAANYFYESGLFASVDPAFMLELKTDSVNDPMYHMQWGLKNNTFPGYDINVEGAWNITKGYGAKIAIIDNGVDDSHYELYSNFASISYDVESGNNSSEFDPDEDHGTHVAGIMVAKGNNNLQIAGVAHEANLMRVSQNNRYTLSYKIANGINWAWMNGADVINCSWSLSSILSDGEIYSSVIEEAIDSALTRGRSNKGTVVVFASGNDATYEQVMSYPATCDDRILTVGAIDQAGLRAVFSGYGEKLDLVAPGHNIYSTVNGNGVNYMSGTSMAAPHVSGVVALMIAANPYLTREEIEWIIEQSAREINPEDYLYISDPDYHGLKSIELGHGLVDATKAVMVARDFRLTPPVSSPALNYYVMSGATMQYDTWFVMGNNPTANLYFSVPPQYNSPAYSHFWHITSNNGGWTPTMTFHHLDTQVWVDVPRPYSDSSFTISCEIYDDNSHVCTATLTLTARLNPPRNSVPLES